MDLSDLVEKSQAIRVKAPNPRRLHWPSEFREEVVSVVLGGTPILQISQATGIAHQTIRGWVKGGKRSFRKVEVKQEFRQGDLVLLSRKGFEFRGLSLEQLVYLLEKGLL